jgi:hypothetical protein
MTVKCNDRLDNRLDDRTTSPMLKPVLRIGAYHHAVGSDALAEFPLRLRSRNGNYYWSMARAGEYHWWLTVEDVKVYRQLAK